MEGRRVVESTLIRTSSELLAAVLFLSDSSLKRKFYMARLGRRDREREDKVHEAKREKKEKRRRGSRRERGGGGSEQHVRKT